jgi:hypothetical protein
MARPCGDDDRVEAGFYPHGVRRLFVVLHGLVSSAPLGAFQSLCDAPRRYGRRVFSLLCDDSQSVFFRFFRTGK